MEKKLRKFFPISKFTKLVNLLVLETQGEERNKKFIMDSGSGHDLIASRKADRMDMDLFDDDVINFCTASGVTMHTFGVVNGQEVP